MSVQCVANDAENGTTVLGGRQESPTLTGARDVVQRPLFILAPPRSFTSLVCAMLGQHPQMYGLPELHLLDCDNIRQWFARCTTARTPLANGLLRAVAQLCFGGQTDATVQLARGWLRRRMHLSAGYVVETLARMVQPRILVEKSPSLTRHRRFLQQVHVMFPEARFIHLVRHPRSHGESVLKLMRELERDGPLPRWLRELAGDEASPAAKSRHAGVIDPQHGWLERHQIICEFLESIPQSQHIRVRGEDLLSAPDGHLKRIADWLQLRTDAQAIEAMKHPERSVFACRGPKGAGFGNDLFFVENPSLRPAQTEALTLDGRWRDDDTRFSEPVRQLARRFGYQ
jgi:hypothetical protein